MQPTAACPELTQYKKLASGQLSAPEQEAVLDHLEKCQACVQRVESLWEMDTLVDLIRQARTLGEGATGETVARLVEQLRKLRPSAEAAPEGLNLAPTGAARDRRTAVTQSYQRTEPSEPASKALYDFLAPAQLPDELGRLGPYRVLKVLGAGGMGVVFQAEDPQLQRIVALKAMLPGLAANDSAKQRFLREARAVAALKHDHIVTIFQVGADRGATFLAMEFLQGEPLEDRLKREGKLPLTEVLRIGREMAEGLTAAHEHGLIHRDIKPANVWLEGKTGRVKILDFGLARAWTGEAHLTQAGAIVGTPDYMAPEQAQGKSVDPRCDLFSLGCVLYRMATGKAPFRGTDMISTLMAVATENPRPPHELEPDLPPALSALILSLLAKEAGNRPASAQAVAQTLESIARPSASRSDGRAHRRRRRWPIAVAIALVLGLGGWLLASVVFKTRVRTVEGEAFIVLEVEQAGAEVSVDGGKVRVTVPGDNKPVEIQVMPGQHTLRISKDGFVALTRDIELKTGKSDPIRVRLEQDPKSAQKVVPTTSPVDALRRADIPEAALASLGGGDPKRAPPELVGVLGDGRFRITDSFFPAFSPDGSLLAVPSGGEVCLFNANSGHLLRRFRGRSGRVCGVAFSPNGAMLAMGDEQLVRLWDPRSGVLLQDLSGHAPGLMSGVAFTADSQTVLSGSSDKTVRVWDVTTGGQRRVLSCPSEVRSIAVTPDGRLAVAGTNDGHVHGWSLDTGAEKFVLEVAKQLQTWVSVSANGQWLAGGTGNTLKVWKIADLATKDPTPFFEKQTPAECLQFEKTSNKLWMAKHNCPTPDNNRAWCWDPASGQLVSSVALRSSGAPWMHVAISPDGRTVAALGHNDRMVQLYDTRTGKPRFPDPGHTSEVDSVAFSPDGRWQASGSRDHTIRVWDLATGTPRHTLAGHTEPVRSVAFSPDGKLLASGSEDGTIALWDPVSGARVHKLDGHCRDSSVRFSPDGKLVASGTADGGVRLWFTRNGEEARMLPRLHEGLVRCLAFSADGRCLATGGEDGKLVITELASGKVLQSFKRDSAVFTVEFGADGETVAAGYVPPEPVVRVWNLKDKDFVKLGGHRDRVNTVSLRSDGRLVVTTSLDGSVRLWEIGANPPRQMILGLGSISGSLSPDGRYVATGNSNGTISLFRLPGPAENVGAWMAARGSPPPGLSEEAWLERVKGLYFGRVPDAVVDRLRELNPGFDGKVEYELDGKDVVKLSFLTANIKDISPLRALPGLRSLACGGAWPVFGQITDLTPLEGMKLTSLYLRDTYVADLSPLKGMPLTNLVCTGTKVAHLSPLKGMPLMTLFIDTTPVADLSPLKGMKLETLSVYNTPVADLSPLKDMKLRNLDCTWTQVTDAGLAPLQEMSSLRALRIGNTKMTEDGLAHLKKLTDLETLTFFDKRLTEAGLRNLKGMTKLQVLELPNTGLTDADLVHLKGFLGLRVLNLARTRVTDAGLEHLVGLTNLVTLDLAHTAVTGKGVAKLKAALLQYLVLRDTGLTDEDLVQLKGFLGLRLLSLVQTRVTDAGLEHLAGLKNLVELYLNNTAVTDKGVAKLKAALPQCKIIR